MFANLRRTQVLPASLLLLASRLLVSGATIPDLLPEPVSGGDVRVYTVDNGNAAHGRVIIGGGGGGMVSVSATAGSVSDDACFIETTTGEFPRTHFQRPEADRCFDIGAFRKLKIWEAAACEDGSAALLARYDAPGCGGGGGSEPAMLDAVGGDMTRTCLDMPTKGPASYAFWCTGEIKEAGGKEAAAASDVDGDNGGGSGSRKKKGGLGTFVLALSVIGLIGLMMLVITIYRLLKMSQWFLSLFNKDGVITLN
ncbi:hypothetical protein F4809DRAFT_510137 [Biscogniauxia mediterranea]|nr:hypothetical protein F4809DRAFT_510137 [Biscogniauxia mediterranea]